MIGERRREGYLMIDHRFSPGIPEDIARASGMDPKLCGEGTLFEVPTLTCAHCKVGVVKNPMRQRERNKCFKCGWHYICDYCAADMARPDYDHAPYEKMAEAAIKQQNAQVTVSPPPRTLILPT